MWEFPDFLDVPRRERKPRQRGLTHVLDKGLTLPGLESLLAQAGHLVDVVKIGWGIGYVDPTTKARVSLCHDADVTVCLGGTLLEVAAGQHRIAGLCRWAADLGIDALEVSNGLEAMASEDKLALIAQLSGDFTVFAETGSKLEGPRPAVENWVGEMEADLGAGATWVIAEGRESGTSGLYDKEGRVDGPLVEAIVDRIPPERVIFEAPLKPQQAWFVRRLGPDANLGNIPPSEVLPLETLRLGLRSDTARPGPDR